MPSNVPKVIPAATVVASWPLNTVLATFASIPTHAPLAKVLHISFLISSNVCTTAVKSFISTLSTNYSFMLSVNSIQSISASVPVLSHPFLRDNLLQDP